MNVNDAFPSRYLKASDLGDGQPVVTISHVEMEDVGQGSSKQRKPIVYFQGKQKGLVLNKTNATAITRAADSHDTDHWPGVRVRLVAAEVEFQGETMMAIRVRPAPTGNGHAAPTAKAIAKPAPIEPEHDDHGPISDDDIPF